MCIRNRKGQTLTGDFMVSILIFGIILISSLKLIDAAYMKKNGNAEMEITIQKTMRLADYLIRNEGVPKYWNKNDVEIIGFAESDHIINISKFEEFQKMSYELQRIKLGIGGLDFYTTLKNESGIIVVNNNALIAGKIPTSDVDVKIGVKRFVYLNVDGVFIPAVFELVVWR